MYFHLYFISDLMSLLMDFSFPFDQSNIKMLTIENALPELFQTKS